MQDDDKPLHTETQKGGYDLTEEMCQLVNSAVEIHTPHSRDMCHTTKQTIGYSMTVSKDNMTTSNTQIFQWTDGTEQSMHTGTKY